MDILCARKENFNGGVMFIETENTFRPERVHQIAERGHIHIRIRNKIL